MVLCSVVLGGMGNFLAVMLGAFIIQFISYLPQLIGLSSVIPAQAKQIIFGLILVIMMIYRPQGILGRKKRDNSRAQAFYDQANGDMRNADRKDIGLEESGAKCEEEGRV